MTCSSSHDPFGHLAKAAQLAVSALALTACGAEPMPSEEAFKDLARSYQHLHGSESSTTTICSEELLPLPNGDVQTVIEQYDFELLQRELEANPEVAYHSGVTQLETCDDARAYMAFHQQLMESLEPEEEPEQEPEASADAVAVTSQELKGGTLLAAERGMVKFSWVDNRGVRQHVCSGFLFSSRVMVTAAHCLAQRTGAMSVDVHYFDRGAGGQRKIAAQGVDVLQFHQHPDWKGGTDTPNDVGIIVRADAWPGTGPIDYLPILWGSPGVMRTMTAFGSGYESFEGSTIGRLRTANWGVSSNENNRYLITRPESSRLCQGDSGGAGTFFMSGGRTAVTVHANGEMYRGDHCVCKGCKARHAVVTPLIVNWIRGKLPMSCIWTTDTSLQQSFVKCQ